MSWPSGYPRAFAAPALVVAIARAPALRDHGSTARVPGVEEHERLARDVEGAEALRLLALAVHSLDPTRRQWGPWLSASTRSVPTATLSREK